MGIIAKKVVTSTMLSSLAYQDFADIEKHLLLTGSYDIQFIDNPHTDTQGFMCQDDDHIYINIRGTEFTNIKDWLTNLDCNFVQLKPWGLVHRGFYRDAASVMVDINTYLFKYADRNKKIVFGGHSQGAAVVTVIAMIAAQTHFFDSIVQVGCPRSADQLAAMYFGQKYGSKIYFLQNNNDLVTRIPPRSWGFQHIEETNLLYFMEGGKLVTSITAWDEFKDRVKGRLYDIGEMGADSIKDHDHSGYGLLALENIVS